MNTETDKTKADLDTMRHSTSHVMAEAVLRLFPDARFGIGPTIENGFYYDFELCRPLTPDDLPAIEAGMKEVVKENKPFQQEMVDKETARKVFAGQPYKLELIDDLPDEKVTIYRQNGFTDLCRGPHLASTGRIGHFKLLSIAGAYWRGDEHRPMLQRIYGVAFQTRAELDEHLHKLEEAAKRDHRKLGKDLDLFSIQEQGGAGLVLWHPKGALIRKTIEDFWREEHLRRGYDIVYTPHIFKAELWKISGHLEMYREFLYSPMDVEGQEYLLKPMNCPGHIMIFNSKLRSYRELPIRMAELGTVYRYERSGVLHGLARVRGFTQDDAHIFCRYDQLEDEVIGVLHFAEFMIKTFGFEKYKVMLSTRPEKYAGTLEIWAEATGILEKALARAKVPYQIDPGEGVFYGPKIDIKLEDALGRDWQGPTIQVDFNNPQRFNVNYVGEDGKEHLVAMVHRVVLGSMERFLACLIEHHGGAFPVWLSPQQAVVIPVADRHLDYARSVESELRKSLVRVTVDSRPERMNSKIREAQLQKVPYMLIVGDKEQAASSVSVRLRTGEDLGGMSVDGFKAMVEEAVKSKSTELKSSKLSRGVE